jgi:anti-sigma B factor antagonist/stage II sporulation protein AA (anti-sigma F factor antagonist)
MEFNSRPLDGVLLAVPTGRIDHAAAGTLEGALMPLLDAPEASSRAVVLDLSGVDYISSVGLRVLMLAAKRMRALGQPIGVAALQPVVAEIFAISRFDRVLSVFGSTREAIQAMKPSALAAFDAARPA